MKHLSLSLLALGLSLAACGGTASTPDESGGGSSSTTTGDGDQTDSGDGDDMSTGGDGDSDSMSSGGSGGDGDGTSTGELIPGQSCPGESPLEGYPTCRTQEDCEGGNWCASGPSTGLCGICFDPIFECVDDEGCADGTVCEEGEVEQCSCGGAGMSCVAACTDDSCDADEYCAEDGHCTATSCSDGFACAEDEICDATRPIVDLHGCAPARCDSDGFECPAGRTCGGDLPDTHGCSEAQCEGDDDCPVNTICDNTATSGSGCMRLTCEEDSDCHCGFCISGMCERRLNVCALPPPP